MARLSAAGIARLLRLPAPTAEQVVVIEAPPEPLLVVAGAGSGKTETMAARVVWLVANGTVRPDQVLGLTFTRKAAAELAERVRRRLRALRSCGLPAPSGSDVGDGWEGVAEAVGEPVVATYHSYAAGLVGEHALRLGVEPAARVLSEAGAWQLAAELVDRWDGEMDAVPYRPETVTDAVLALAAECAEHLVEPGRVAEHLDDLAGRIAQLDSPRGGTAPYAGVRAVLGTLGARRQIVPLVEAYRDLKTGRGLLDFGDQVALAARVATEVPGAVRQERSRYRAVLLDEYQDTSHAQLTLLRSLFGQAHPVTAVGDPHQCVYGWRGASSANLQSFPAHFPRDAGSPARVAHLSTSWRNDGALLAAANVIAGPLSARSRVPVRALAARAGAGRGRVEVSYHLTVSDEAAAVADRIADLWRAGRGTPGGAGCAGRPGRQPSLAVLCRTRGQIPPVHGALLAAGVPVQVIGLGGLLSTPEVVEVVSVLRVLDDPSRGDALLRLLTGSGWRIGPRDLEALSVWSRSIAEPEGASLVEALDRLPPDGWVGRHGRGFSPTGLARMRRLAGSLRCLRRAAGVPLPGLVGEVARLLRLDVEVAARPGVRQGAAGAQLEAFADAAQAYADGSQTPTLSAFLGWLDAAVEVERGLAPAEVATDPDAVQVLTVHAAKGLEWDAVAVPGLSEGTFPSADRGTGWLSGPTGLPYPLRGDADDLPCWRVGSAADQRDLDRVREEFKRACQEHQLAQERRLAYVAFTRARHLLLLSGAWWGEGARSRTPSVFLRELHAAGADHDEVGVPIWVSQPGPDPRRADAGRRDWPVDPLGPLRPALQDAADLVRAELANLDDQDDRDDRAGARPPEAAQDEWAREVDLLLAERDALRQPEPFRLPTHLSASRLVQLADDPVALATALRRPMPPRPSPAARRGTSFHAWLERRWNSDALLALDDVPGATGPERACDEQLALLQQHFLASAWALQDPVAVEVPVETPVGDLLVRGRIDAVFRRPDGGYDVVDWKTGPVPTGRAADAQAVQLAVYRLAWARRHAVELERVGAAFFYPLTGTTVRPVDLLTETDLVALVTARPAPGQAHGGWGPVTAAPVTRPGSPVPRQGARDGR